MNSTKDNWIKAFEERWFVKNGELKVETYMDILDFIKKVEKDAIEKTNKRWRKTEIELLAYLLDRHIDEGSYFGRKDQHYKMVKQLKIKLSDLLEDKESV